jgi:hypothetical protein
MRFPGKKDKQEADAPEVPEGAAREGIEVNEGEARKAGLLSRLKASGKQKKEDEGDLASAFVDSKPKKPGFGAGLRKGRTDATGRPKKKKKAAGAKGLTKRSAFVFIAGDDGAILVFLQGGKVARRLFAPGPEKEHFGPVRDLIEKHPKVPLYFLADMIDQSYVRHTLPPVSALSVQKLVNRRLERDFSPDDIKGALPLGREKAGRKEWNFLLISLAASAGLQQWLDPLLEMPNRFAGIYLLPVEAQHLIAGLSDALVPPPADDSGQRASQWKLLVVHDKVGGIRQVVVRGQQLIFTRLTQAGDAMQPEVIAGNIEQEILNTIEYLRRLSFDEGAGLDVFMVVGQDIKEVVDIHRFSARNIHLLTPFEASQVLKLEQAALSGDRFADVVVGAYFGLQKKHALKLNPAYATALEKLYQAKLGLQAGTILAALGLLYMIVSSGMNYIELQDKNESSRRELAGAKVELEKTQEKAEALDQNRNDIADMAALYRSTRRIEKGPSDFVAKMAEILPQDVFLTDLSWNVDNLAGDQQGGGNSYGGGSQQQTDPGYKVVMKLEFTDHQDSRKRFFEQASSFLELLAETYPDYDVEHSTLAGDEEAKDSLVVNFDEEDKRDILLGGENVVEITLSWPKKDTGTQNNNGMNGGDYY